MVQRRSPRLNVSLSKAAQKKNSSKVFPTKNHGGTPSEKSRAVWNPVLEKTLVDLLHEHNTPNYRGQSGWTIETWNKIVKEFHEKENYVTFTKTQIQDKEKELKRKYKLLKEVIKQSGASWSNQTCMIQAAPAIWDKIIKLYPQAKKFRNQSFPLFEALGQLYDGQSAERTCNFNSSQPLEYPDPTPAESRDELRRVEVVFPNLEENLAIHGPDDADARVQANEDEDATVGKGEQRPQRRAAPTTRNKEEKGAKRHKKSGDIEGPMGRYINMRSKQAEDEAARLAREKGDAQGNDFSIKRCISVLNTMEVTKEEKAKAYGVFKNPDNREIFLSAYSEDLESTLIWLRSEMA
ncbi:hypothetical protein U9M48_033630 [Paspalum notatum var. saurae]|uniref:Myb/SANT-like domain-containing protein n=1 Tax=Paspalum notatum var. saurae TaxID=547442 RepID=A0AAQ3UAC3_PASNO